ncbi:phosphoadenylyl-sulfate reductase [Aestuariirhabdus litorea]|uniref:Adenosine 5'-phosphosulfate reductase n=1 Tax=Aestuariirhabdus litorea TaxID=2528527 RepID=A0A3P3VTU3_9GAMM|nr:phosphoadenylyl-sulfate reductase [Aestuariirhabdus litorea]RRJ84869.1 phosphoadenylyl-sulfate reductase [Aestuariirhabdus litorea]RWW98095.1 phosphoadenylyl-sulfate reductase [Endozoicomonadaceae bacterium GTF-13]
MSAEFNTKQLNETYQDQTPQQILELAFKQFDNIALSFSGAEDVALIEMASKLTDRLQVFCLDTGRLHPQTYRFIEKVRNHYQIEIELIYPEAAAVEELVKSKGLFSFYADGHSECCSIRKIAPLRKKLSGVDAWITGQRKDQSPGTRSDIPVIETDPTFSGARRELVKFNPLANWSSREVWDFIWMFDVPYNELHDQGFISIGCEPCTRAVRPNQHEREGRWWWEESTAKECGLHVGNIQKS